jgi:hypothetical protein
LNDIIGDRASKKYKTIQLGSNVGETGSFEPTGVITLGESSQVVSLEIDIITGRCTRTNTVNWWILDTFSSDTHSNGSQSLGWEIGVVGRLKSIHSSSQIRFTGIKSTSSNTIGLFSEHVHGTIGQSDKHLRNVTDWTTIGRIIEEIHSTSSINDISRPERGSSSGCSFVTLDGSSGSSTVLLTGEVGERRAQLSTIGPPLSHTSIDVSFVSSNVELNSNIVVEIGHSDVDIVWTNDKLVKKGLDEALELSHWSVANGRRVIDVDPNVHLGVTDTTRRLGDGNRSAWECLLIEDKGTSILEGHLTDCACCSVGAEAGDDLVADFLGWGVDGTTEVVFGGSRGDKGGKGCGHWRHHTSDTIDGTHWVTRRTDRTSCLKIARCLGVTALGVVFVNFRPRGAKGDFESGVIPIERHLSFVGSCSSRWGRLSKIWLPLSTSLGEDSSNKSE